MGSILTQIIYRTEQCGRASDEQVRLLEFIELAIKLHPESYVVEWLEDIALDVEENLVTPDYGIPMLRGYARGLLAADVIDSGVHEDFEDLIDDFRGLLLAKTTSESLFWPGREKLAKRLRAWENGGRLARKIEDMGA